MAKTGELIDRLCKIFCFISLFVMVVSIGAQVFCRYMLNNPLSWPEEISMTAFCCLGFAGVAMVSEKNAHLRIDILPVLFPRAKKFLDASAVIVNLLYLAFLAWLCWDMTLKTRMLGQELLAVPLPVWLIWAYMCLLALCASVQTGRVLMSMLHRIEEE